MEEWPPIWRLAANILNKRLQTVNKGSPPTWGLGEVLTTPHLKNWPCCETDTLSLTNTTVFVSDRMSYRSERSLV